MSDKSKIRRRQRCPRCGSLDVIRWGIRNGVQRFKCRDCSALFSARRKEITQCNRKSWFRKWVLGKMTIEEIAKSSGYSARQLHRWFDEYLEEQPKFSVIIGNDNKMRYTREGEQGTYIMKPRPTGYQIINKDYCVANEHVTMQIASQVYGIETAPDALCFFEDDKPAYITRRFDVHPEGKYKQEDFAALLGWSKDNGGKNFKYDRASYEDCAEVIYRYVKAALIDIRRFYRIILFNFVTLNDDAHLKNFSLIERNGEYRLSPAYDLVNTSLQLYEPHIFALDRGLFREGMSPADTHTIGYDDFVEFGRRIGLTEKVIMKEIQMFQKPNLRAIELIDKSFLSEDLKKQYITAYSYRCNQVLRRS